MQRNAIRQAVDEAFKTYPQNTALDKIKAEMAEALEDRYAAMHRRGVIEEAALKKVLADFAAILNKTGRFNPQGRLEYTAKSLGISPLGRGQAFGRLLASLLGLAGLAAIFCVFWVIGGAQRSFAAGAPFLSVAGGIWLYLQLTAYHADKRPFSKGKAVFFALALSLTLAGVFALLVFTLSA